MRFGWFMFVFSLVFIFQNESPALRRVPSASEEREIPGAAFLSASYAVVQKWGNIDLTVSYSNYFHDWSKNNLSIFGYLELRIAKGLSVTLVGSASMIHDQLGLVKADVPVDQILLQRKQLATRYEYFTSFGFTYTFGSIYNNVVNPRFGNSSGEGISISIN